VRFSGLSTQKAVNRWMKSKTYFFITIGFLMILMVLVLIETFSFPKQQGVAYGFGPAIFPMLIAGGVLLCGIISILQTLFENKEDDDKKLEFKWDDLKRPALLFGMSILYVIALETFGFLATNISFLLVTLLAYKNGKASTLTISIVVTAILYILFKMVLKVPLPAGTII
jgi:putative tricarboxylic transport membrane protein